MQQSLADARSVLARRGVLYPGTERSQWTATTAMLGLPHLYWPEDPPPRPEDRGWGEIIDELRNADAGHRRVISAESMCAADERQVDRVVDDLCPVRVVVAVRRLDRHLVSNWQQRLRVGLDVDLDRWLARILDAEDRGDVVGTERVFGLMSAEVVGRWVDRVGSDRVAVVVVDEQQRTQLDALESMLDLAPGDLRVSADPEARNRSLTAEEASILLGINCMIDRSETSFDDHRRVIVPMVEMLQRRPQGDG